MIQPQMFEAGDCFLTLDDDNGKTRTWRVLSDGSLVEYESWPLDARDHADGSR